VSYFKEIQLCSYPVPVPRGRVLEIALTLAAEVTEVNLFAQSVQTLRMLVTRMVDVELVTILLVIPPETWVSVTGQIVVDV
jgi:hypothetical protein